MPRFLTILLCSTVLTLASARVYHLPSPGREVQSLRWHMRALPDGTAPSTWGIRWYDTDTTKYRFIEIRHPGIDGTDNVSGTLLTVALGERCGDTVTVDSTVRFTVAPYPARDWRGGVSIRMDGGPQGLTAAVGSQRATHTFPLKDAVGAIRRLESYGSDRVGILLDTVAVTDIPLPQYVDADTAIARARSGRDPRESLWTYFDRDTDPLRSRLGGRYELASVADPDGTVRLIYLGGATADTDRWRPGRVKAELRPTLIPGVYDLTWYAADGTPLSLDTGATLEDHLLTLQFPDRRATIRFRRR